jgi:hypothetical protein
MDLVIERDGTVRGVYAEAIDLSGFGDLSIRRASHVEPDARGRWWADLAPVAGPKLGPFGRRSEALAAEMTLLNVHWCGGPRWLGSHQTAGGSELAPLIYKEDRPWD